MGKFCLVALALVALVGVSLGKPTQTEIAVKRALRSCPRLALGLGISKIRRANRKFYTNAIRFCAAERDDLSSFGEDLGSEFEGVADVQVPISPACVARFLGAQPSSRLTRKSPAVKCFDRIVNKGLEIPDTL